MCITQPWLRSVFGVKGTIAENTWWDISPISAGLFGVPLGFAVIIIVSLLTPAPDRETQELVDHVRYPVLEGDIDTAGHLISAEETRKARRKAGFSFRGVQSAARGEMSEWFKEHAWKACVGESRTVGSNPTLSA